MDRAAQESRRRRLAALLRTLREERGMLQAELAARLDEPQSYVSKLESSERRVEFIRLEDYCVALNLPLEEFLKRWRAISTEEG